MFETLLSVHCVRLTDRNDKEAANGMDRGQTRERYRQWTRAKNNTVKHQIPNIGGWNSWRLSFHSHLMRIWYCIVWYCACVSVCIRLILKNIIMYTVKVESHSVLCGIISHKVYREQFLCGLYFRRCCLVWFGISRYAYPKMRSTRQGKNLNLLREFRFSLQSYSSMVVLFFLGKIHKNCCLCLHLAQSLPTISLSRSTSYSHSSKLLS